MRKVFPVDPAFFADIAAPMQASDFEAEVVSIRDLRLHRLVRQLPPLERRVIRWYFGLDCEELNTCQIAERMGTSRQYVSKVKNRALARLRGGFGDVTVTEALAGEFASAA